MKVLHKIKYTFKANHFKGYAIHSPFIFRVVSDLIYAKHPFYSFGSLRDYRSRLSRKEKKTALTLKNANRLYRLVNTLQPQKVEMFQPDRFDTFLHSVFKAAKGSKSRQQEGRNLYYLANGADAQWVNAFPHLSTDDGSVWVVKHPTTLNKTSWNKILQSESVRATITFFGMGIAFTDSVLPRKNFRIV